MTRGIRIDHVGVTVPDIDAATAFFAAAFDAVVLYDVRRTTDVPNGTPEAHRYLGIPDTMAQGAIRMLALPEGPGLELFEYRGPDQRAAAHPSDLGWQHLALYVDDLDEALLRLEAAGAVRNSDPRPLRGEEAGRATASSTPGRRGGRRSSSSPTRHRSRTCCTHPGRSGRRGRTWTGSGSWTRPDGLTGPAGREARLASASPVTVRAGCGPPLRSCRRRGTR